MAKFQLRLYNAAVQDYDRAIRQSWQDSKSSCSAVVFFNRGLAEARRGQYEAATRPSGGFEATSKGG